MQMPAVGQRRMWNSDLSSWTFGLFLNSFRAFVIELFTNETHRHPVAVESSFPQLLQKSAGNWSEFQRLTKTLRVVIWPQAAALDRIYHQIKNCFLFWQIISKIHNKDDKISVLCLFLFISMGFGTVFVVYSSFSSCYNIKNVKNEKFPAGQSHPPKADKISHFYASYSNHFHRHYSHDIWPHSIEKCLWSNIFY